MSQLPRLWHCGRHLVDARGTYVALKAGTAYFTGVQTCASIWACPVCAARIRQRRAGEIESAGVQHLAQDGGLGFGTFTLPHQRTDDLDDLLGVVQKAWEKVQQNRAVRRLFDRFGITGRIRATEITYGSWHGWHPHLHLLFFANTDLSHSEWSELRDTLSDAWASAVVTLGRSRPGDVVGVTLGKVYRADVGKYLAKVQDHYGEASTIGKEMARGDVKRGRKRSRTPFEIAEQAVLGVVPDLPLWWAYEQATKGRRAIEWSRGLKARFDLSEKSDEDLAAEDAGGELVVHVDHVQWGLLITNGQETHLLDLVEQGGAPAAHRFLSTLGEAA